MQIYLVGGAVRDALMSHATLPRAAHVDRDWVVVGATPEAMVAQGFLPVGRDFPVFLHPTRARNTPWPAPSARPRPATTASPSTPRRASRWKTTWPGAT
jgi:hypothetical protein